MSQFHHNLHVSIHYKLWLGVGAVQVKPDYISERGMAAGGLRKGFAGGIKRGVRKLKKGFL